MRYPIALRAAVVLSLAVVLLLAVSCQQSSTPESAAPQAQASMVAAPQKAPSRAEMVARGKYLVTIAACHDCHSPKNPDMSPVANLLLSGRPATTNAPHQPAVEGEISAAPDLTAWWGPWGVTYAANLTPDPETGIDRKSVV